MFVTFLLGTFAACAAALGTLLAWPRGAAYHLRGPAALVAVACAAAALVLLGIALG